MSKPAARNPTDVDQRLRDLRWCAAPSRSLLVVAGIAWITVYTHVADGRGRVREGLRQEAATPRSRGCRTCTSGTTLIGFGLVFLGLIIAAHPKTPLGRGRGVVVGMLGCFLIGLAWIVTYYFVAQSATAHIPVMDKLDQMNLIVGVAFMAVGFTFATKWE